MREATLSSGGDRFRWGSRYLRYRTFPIGIVMGFAQRSSGRQVNKPPEGPHESTAEPNFPIEGRGAAPVHGDLVLVRCAKWGKRAPAHAGPWKAKAHVKGHFDR